MTRRDPQILADRSHSVSLPPAWQSDDQLARYRTVAGPSRWSL